MIETRLLRQFVAVAEELHFHRAAKRLHMAQPPLSQAIRKLEDELGVRLFERSNRNVTLTPAGLTFLDTARRTLAQLNAGAEQARRVAAGVSGRLVVTFVGTAHYDLLPDILRAFRSDFPGIELKLQEATTAEQIEAVRVGDADVGFMRRPRVSVPHLTFKRIARERILIALPNTHSEARKATVALTRLAEEGFIATPRAEGAGFYDQLISLCRQAGFSPRIVQEARQMHTVVSLVAGGLGVALVPSTLAQARRKGVTFRPIAVDAPQDLKHIDLVMGWDATRTSPARDSFLKTAQRIAAALI